MKAHAIQRERTAVATTTREGSFKPHPAQGDAGGSEVRGAIEGIESRVDVLRVAELCT